MKSIICLLLIVFKLAAPSANAQLKNSLKLPRLFSDHMVLQQKSNTNFWGYSLPNQQISIAASWGKYAHATADSLGKWKIKLQTPKAGGPYSISLKTAGSSITINDVMIGEVWLASGQSNMDIPLKGWPPGDTIKGSKQEITDANYPAIRFMKVPFNISAHPVDSCGGNWVTVSPETAGNLSATAYFYARKLHKALNVPIGVIQSSIGGTPAEAWTSKDHLEPLGDFNKLIDDLENLQNSSENWFRKWQVQAIPNTTELWKNISFSDFTAAKADFNDANWRTVTLPGRVDILPSGEIDGAMWLRRTFIISDTSTDYLLKIGAIDDMDATYINGTYVGGLVGEGFATKAREILIPNSLLKRGANTISIRVIDTGGPGAVQGPITLSNIKEVHISLAGDWKSRVVAEILNGKFYCYGLQSDISLRPDFSKLNSNSPTVLFNAMIHPLIPYTIKGVIWYQGESNVGRAEQYKRLFPAMIEDWRDKWRSKLPFYFVQIAPFLYTAPDQKEQSQKLRNAQRYALKLPKTGMVTTLDIGYLKTAHPPFKQEVGERLASFALANDYGKSLVTSGPLFKKVIASGNELIIEFDSVAGGLIAGNAGLLNFEIAGTDKIYVQGKAQIINNKVLVTSPLIASPVYVRYAWSDGASASLFNKEGLPAATFTSEE